jgi:hypothetical protein
LVGTDVPKQSLYENDRRELRADYLARLAAAKVDVVYVLTGQRSQGDWLDDGATDLVSAFLSLPPDLKESLLGFARSLQGHFAPAPGRTLHNPRLDYRAGEPR